VRVVIAGTRGLEITRSGAAKSDPPLELAGIELESSGGFNGEKGDASGTTVLLDALARPLVARAARSGSIGAR